MTKFTSFNTRYYNSKIGKLSSDWLRSILDTMTQQASNGLSVKVKTIKHKWKQSSFIVQVADSKWNQEDMNSIERVIVGSHLDSINQWDPYSGVAPGADDDGSGVTALVEVLRILLGSSFIPSKLIEFHFYSAEEIGLLGSQEIAQMYNDQNVNVVAMFQADMTGYTPPEKKPVIAVGSDYSDKAFSVSIIMAHVRNI